MGRMSKPARIEAEADEREGLRRRFRLEALNSLAAEYTLAKDEGKIIANGRIMADLVQACVATAAPVPEKIDEAFTKIGRASARERECQYVYISVGHLSLTKHNTQKQTPTP